LTCAIFNNYYYECTLDMTWYIANEAHSAELAITSLTSNKHEWDNCFIKFFKPQKFEVQSKSEKSKKIRAKSKKKLDEDAMLCNTLLSDRRRLIRKKHFLLFRVLLSVCICFSFLVLFREKFRFPAKTFLA